MGGLGTFATYLFIFLKTGCQDFHTIHGKAASITLLRKRSVLFLHMTSRTEDPFPTEIQVVGDAPNPRRRTEMRISNNYVWLFGKREQ